MSSMAWSPSICIGHRDLLIAGQMVGMRSPSGPRSSCCCRARQRSARRLELGLHEWRERKLRREDTCSHVYMACSHARKPPTISLHWLVSRRALSVRWASVEQQHMAPTYARNSPAQAVPTCSSLRVNLRSVCTRTSPRGCVLAKRDCKSKRDIG